MQRTMRNSGQYIRLSGTGDVPRQGRITGFSLRDKKETQKSQSGI